MAHKGTAGRNTGTKCTVYESKKFLNMDMDFPLILLNIFPRRKGHIEYLAFCLKLCPNVTAF